MINRCKPTPALVNARKKLTLLCSKDMDANALALRAIPLIAQFSTQSWLCTGLYCQDPKSENWHYVHERSIKEPVVRSAGVFRRFLTNASSHPTTWTHLLESSSSLTIWCSPWCYPVLSCHCCSVSISGVQSPSRPKENTSMTYYRQI